MKLRSIAIALLIVATAPTFGKVLTRPFFLGCHPVGFAFSENGIILNPLTVEDQQQTLYLFHNRSIADIKIKANEQVDPNLVPSLTVKLNGDSWGAFATLKSGLVFLCYTDQGAQVNCQNVLEVCQYPRAKFSGANNGTYWVSSNQTKFAARDEVVHKGILLKNWYPGWQSTEIAIPATPATPAISAAATPATPPIPTNPAIHK